MFTVCNAPPIAANALPTKNRRNGISVPGWGDFPTAGQMRIEHPFYCRRRLHRQSRSERRLKIMSNSLHNFPAGPERLSFGQWAKKIVIWPFIVAINRLINNLIHMPVDQKTKYPN